MKIGAYKITFPGDEFYIGSARGKRGFEGRWNDHRKGRRNSPKYLQELAQKYGGWDCAEFIVLREAKNKHRALLWEQAFINKNKENSLLLNKNRNIFEQPDMTGKNHYLFGKHHTEETREKMRGKNHYLFGKHHSEEAKKKMSEAHKDKHPSEETRKKLSEAQAGKPKSEETKKKMSEARKGKHHSEETKKKMRKPKSERTKKKISKALSAAVYSKIGPARERAAVYCDMDGVLVDLNRGLQELLNNAVQDYRSLPLHVKTLVRAAVKSCGSWPDHLDRIDPKFSFKLKHMNKHTSTPEIEKLAWELMLNNRNFWATLFWNKEGPQLWDFLSTYSNVYILTIPVDEACKDGKRDWIENSLKIPRDRILFSTWEQGKKEYSHKNSILIDDSACLISKFQEGEGKGIHYSSFGTALPLLLKLLP